MNLRKWWNGDAVREELIRKGVELNRRAAEYLAERARMYAPVDTGLLRSSIHVISSMNGTVFHVICDCAYAVHVEFGSLRGGRWVAPNPFMRKALADTKQAFPELAKSLSFRGGTGGEGRLGVSFGAAA